MARRFTWFDAKAASNAVDHRRVTFDLAQLVWNDLYRVEIDDWFVDGQQRYHAIGFVRVQTCLLMVFVREDSPDDEIIHIISARRATATERKVYERENA